MLMAENLEIQLSARSRAEAAAHMVTSLQAMHQAALDGGSWANAVHMVPDGDPLHRDEFGGDEETLEAVHSYRKSIAELKKKITAAGVTEGDETADAPGGQKAGPKAKGKA